MFKKLLAWLLGVGSLERDWLAAFEQKFPGRCPICAYHQYGQLHEFKVLPQPDPHECIELRDGK